MVMGPVALVSDELQTGRLLAPIRQPLRKTRGYFFYAPAPSIDAPAIAALQKWLIGAGSVAESELSTYLSASRS